MTLNTQQPARPALPAFTNDFQSLAERRIVCKALRLHRFCSFARCRRTHRCQGDPRRCLETHGAAVPLEVRTVVEATLLAGRYERVEPGSGERWLDENYRREIRAFAAWDAGIEARR